MCSFFSSTLVHLTALQYLHITQLISTYLVSYRSLVQFDPEWLEVVRDYISKSIVDVRRLRCLTYPNLEKRICQGSQSRKPGMYEPNLTTRYI